MSRPCGEKPDFWPVSKNNTGSLPLRGILPVISGKVELVKCNLRKVEISGGINLNLKVKWCWCNQP